MNMMNKFFSAVYVLLLLTGSAFAQDKFVLPKQTVTGAEQPIPAGELVILKVTPIETPPKYLTDVKYKWLVLADDKEKKNLLVFPDNTTVGFGRGNAKKVQSLLVVTYLYVVHEGDDPKGKIVEAVVKTSEIIFTEVKFEGVVPPGPGPVDPVDPVDPTAPVLPVGKFDLAKAAYNAATTKVDATNRKKGAVAVASSTAGISSSIRAGALTDPQEILTKLKDANNSALTNAGVPLESWDNFGLELQKKLVELYKAKKLSVASDYADAFDEISTGLQKVK